MFSLKKMEKNKKVEWRRVVKLDFIVWFYIKFDKEINYNFLDKFIIYLKY